MEIPAVAAQWFLPFVLPICFYVAFTDMREMKIKNHAVTTSFVNLPSLLDILPLSIILSTWLCPHRPQTPVSLLITVSGFIVFMSTSSKVSSILNSPLYYYKLK